MLATHCINTGVSPNITVPLYSLSHISNCSNVYPEHSLYSFSQPEGSKSDNVFAQKNEQCTFWPGFVWHSGRAVTIKSLRKSSKAIEGTNMTYLSLNSCS